jgi:hypothetical protein
MRKKKFNYKFALCFMLSKAPNLKIYPGWARLNYGSVGWVSTLTKRIIFFLQKMNFFLKFWNYIHIFHHLLLYCDMSNEIIQSVAYDNYDDFQHVHFIFSKKIISLFWRLFNDETDLRVRYHLIISPWFW